MVHKLCSSERYTPQRRPVATRTLRSPRLCSLCLDKDLLSQLCDQIPGFRENVGGNWREGKIQNTLHFLCLLFNPAEMTLIPSEKQSG